MGRERRIIRELRRAGFTVLSRRQWRSRHRPLYQWRRVHRHFPGKAKAFFAHVTVTNRTGDFAADVRLVERIGYERFRTGISYNWCVDQRTGAIAVGMPHDAAGAHTLNDKNIDGFPENLNYYGHGIAWIGNVGDRPSRNCKDAFSAIIAAEKKHGAARDGARIYPHSKFAWKECPLEVMRRALPAILHKSKTILEGDWFDMADEAMLRKVVRQELRNPDYLKLVSRWTSGRVLWGADLTPSDPKRFINVRNLLMRLRGRSATRQQVGNAREAPEADHDTLAADHEDIKQAHEEQS